MGLTRRLKGRYEPKEIIAQGGMGIVYRALDLDAQSEVALKTLQEAQSHDQIELFRKECAVLRKLRHPNIVDLYDYGVVEENGQKIPFFVMPLIPGTTLDKLIRNHTERLTVERVVDIVAQTCRGLQAAHDMGLVHRDIKPSNLLVLQDDSVKIIDFGVVHLTDQLTRTGLKGTLPYMSPEQLEMLPPTAVSDIFSLAVVCYEALTRRRPFNGNTEGELREAILHAIPPPVSDLNPTVTLGLSQVIRAGMAKQAWQRTSSARQFGDELQRGLRNERIERFDSTQIEPRLARARRALEESEYEFASEILANLDSEGHLHQDIPELRRQIDQALRAKSIAQALESARHRFEKEEYQLALQKVDEVLRLDPANAEAHRLKAEIENKSKIRQIDNWFRLAEDHIKNHAYSQARQALKNVLRVKPTDSVAIRMLSDIDRREAEYHREKREKEELYKRALEAWQRGEVSLALSKLERVLELDQRAPDLASSEAGLQYQNFYNQVRSESDAIKNSYEQARKLLSESNFIDASAICEQFLAKYPSHALFQALRFDIDEGQRQHVSGFIAKIDREVEAEPDLHRKVALLSEALRVYPNETHFRRKLERIIQKRDLVASITQKVKNLEERGQYAEAYGQLEILRAIYPQHPGIDLEIDRISKRREQQIKAESKRKWIDQVDRAMISGDSTHALNLIESALTDFPGDAELLAQKQLVEDCRARWLEAGKVFETAQRQCAEGNVEEGLGGLWQAHRLDEHNGLIRAVLVETLLKRASTEFDRDWMVAEQLTRQAMDLDPGNAQAKGLQRMLADRQRDHAVDEILSTSRQIQATGDLQAAIAAVQKGMVSFPEEPRLQARRDGLAKLLYDFERPEEKEKDLGEMRVLRSRMEEAQNLATRDSIMEQSRVIARKHPGEREFESVFKEIEELRGGTELFDRASEAGTRHSVTESVSDDRDDEPFSERTVGGTTRREIDLREYHEAQERFRRAIGAYGPQPMSWWPFAVIAVGILVVAVLGVVVWRGLPLKIPSIRQQETPPGPSEVMVLFQSSIPAAHVLIDGEDRGILPQQLNLRVRDEGYKVEGKLAGYQSKPKVLQVTGEAISEPVNILLEPLPSKLRLFSDFQQAVLDNETVRLQGAYETAELRPGSHSLKLSNAVSSVNVEFELIPGQLPKIHRASAGQVSLVVLSSLGNTGKVYSGASIKVSVNKEAPQLVGDQGLAVDGLILGPNQLVLTDGAGTRTETVQVDPNPSVTIVVGANPNVGNLRVKANVEGASVAVKSVEGRVIQTGQIANGFALIPRLEPKAYRLYVAAEAYSPFEKEVTIVKGRETPVDVPLIAKPTPPPPPIVETPQPVQPPAPKPTTATLEIKSGTPEAEVVVSGDGRIRKLSVTGDLTVPDIAPGKHGITIRKDRYESKSFEPEFRVGETVSLSGDQAGLTPFGRFEINVNPSNADPLIRYHRVGEDTVYTAKNGETIYVKAGQYSFTITADKFQPLTDTREEVGPGLGTAFNRSLTTLPLAPSPPPAEPRKIGVAGLIGTQRRPDRLYEIIASPALFTEKLPGTYSFKVKTDRRARWFVSYSNEKNYVEFEIDNNRQVIFRVFRDGRANEPVLVPGPALKPQGDFYTLAVEVKEQSITINAQPFLVTDGPANLLSGKFGFPRGEVIGDFEFTESPRR